LRIKEYLHQELSPEQIVGVCSKTDCHVCPQSLFINIFGKIKKKFVFYFYEQLGKGIEKRGSKKTQSVLSNRRLIEDRPKIVDLKQRFGDLRSIL
jgi:IS30 family transposase